MSFSNNLSPAEAERLAWIVEECGEILQAIGKIVRHGYESGRPQGMTSNRQDLEREIGNLLAALLLAEICGDVSSVTIELARDAKFATVGPFLHFQREALVKAFGEDGDETTEGPRREGANPSANRAITTGSRRRSARCGHSSDAWCVSRARSGRAMQ